MSDTPSFYACGSNLHQQLQAHNEHGEPLAVSHLQPFQPSSLVRQLLTITTSQVLYTVLEGSSAFTEPWNVLMLLTLTRQ